VTRDQLVNPASQDMHGYFNGVILGTDSSLFWGGLDEVFRYEREFGVRQLDGFEYPRAQVGQVELDDTSADRNLAGKTASVTTGGRTVLPYLRGPVPLDRSAYGYLAVPTSGDFTPYVTVNNGANPILGVYQHPADDGTGSDPRAGVAEMVMTINYNDTMLHWRLLSRGMLAWVTKGAHLGLARNYLANHVDDVFVSNSTWNTEANCTPGGPPGECSDDTLPVREVRMTPADVDATIAWQKKYGIKLDMAFNASGAGNGDALTQSLLKNKSSFRWINHTWSHLYLGCQAYNVAGDATSGCATWMSAANISSEISQNLNWAQKNNLPSFRKQELVTGEHSGLDNPNMPSALSKTGISIIASDASRQREPYAIGGAVTVPRHPSNVYYNVSTMAEQLDEYNHIYLPPSLGGVCVNTATTTCRSSAITEAEYLDAEAATMHRHLLSNDPRVGYSHQTNLTGDRIILKVLGRVLDDYNGWFATNAPVVNPTFSESSSVLGNQSRWAQALAAGRIEAYVQGGQITIRNTGSAAVTVPVTAPAGTKIGATTADFGAAYAGSRSAWQSLAAGATLTLAVPA
jgi:hypothetical protein